MYVNDERPLKLLCFASESSSPSLWVLNIDDERISEIVSKLLLFFEYDVG